MSDGKDGKMSDGSGSARGTGSAAAGSGGGSSGGAAAAASAASDSKGFGGQPLPVGASRKGAKQWQEDSFFHFVSVHGVVVIGGVFDGHGGYNGLVASTTARDFSVSYFDKYKEECEAWSEKEWNERLPALFSAMHAAIREKFVNEKTGDAKTPGSGAATPTSAKRYVDEKGIVRSPSADPIHGGSTGTMVVFIRNSDESQPQTIITANVGDSTALFIPLKGKCDFLTVVCHTHSMLPRSQRLQRLTVH